MNKAEETRRTIIEKSAPIFNKNGYHGTSISQVAEAIHMTKGAIYGNFANKDEIALAAFDYNFSQMSEKIRAVVLARENACDKLIAFANAYLDKFAEISSNGGCPLLNAAIDADHVHPPLKERVARAVDYWTVNIARIVTSGIKRKEINPNARPEPFASVFISLIEVGLMLAKATGNTIHLSRNVDHIIHLVNSELRL